MSVSKEICENCDAVIGDLETAMVWNGNVVCAACRNKLANEKNDSRLSKVNWIIVASIILVAAAGLLVMINYFTELSATNRATTEFYLELKPLSSQRLLHGQSISGLGEEVIALSNQYLRSTREIVAFLVVAENGAGDLPFDRVAEYERSALTLCQLTGDDPRDVIDLEESSALVFGPEDHVKLQNRILFLKSHGLTIQDQKVLKQAHLAAKLANVTADEEAAIAATAAAAGGDKTTNIEALRDLFMGMYKAKRDGLIH